MVETRWNTKEDDDGTLVVWETRYFENVGNVINIHIYSHGAITLVCWKLERGRILERSTVVHKN